MRLSSLSTQELKFVHEIYIYYKCSHVSHRYIAFTCLLAYGSKFKRKSGSDGQEFISIKSYTHTQCSVNRIHSMRKCCLNWQQNRSCNQNQFCYRITHNRPKSEWLFFGANKEPNRFWPVAFTQVVTIALIAPMRS